VAQLAGDRAAADAFYVRATRLQPENPATWVELGIFRYAAGNACGAYYAFNAAYTLDPKSTFWSSGGPLDLARAAVNNGACEPKG
jgi:lipoprotein NlpI